MLDKSHGYEAIAEDFTRANRAIGPWSVRAWAERLPAGATVLDVACGNGVPISEALLDMGFVVYGVDASPRLQAKSRERFPDVPLECVLSRNHRTSTAPSMRSSHGASSSCCLLSCSAE